MVAATVRTIHAQPDAEASRAQLHTVVTMLQDRFPKAAEILAAAEGDVTIPRFPGRFGCGVGDGP